MASGERTKADLLRADGADERIVRADGSWLLVEWFRRGRGVLGVDRRRPRGGGADHARVTERSDAGRVVGQWIEPEAAVVRRISAFTGGAASASAPALASTTPSGSGSPAPVVPDGRVDVESVCPRCGVAREHVGRRGFLERVRLGLDLGFEGARTQLDLYACPTCRSVELFLADPSDG